MKAITGLRTKKSRLKPGFCVRHLRDVTEDIKQAEKSIFPLLTWLIRTGLIHRFTDKKFGRLHIDKELLLIIDSLRKIGITLKDIKKARRQERRVQSKKQKR